MFEEEGAKQIVDVIFNTAQSDRDNLLLHLQNELCRSSIPFTFINVDRSLLKSLYIRKK